MNQPVTINELKTIIALSDLPDEHLQWILDHSEYMDCDEGTIISKTGLPIDYMWFLLEGKVTFYMDMNGRLIYFYTFENEATTGGVGGLLPYSRMKVSPGYSYAVGKVRGLKLHKNYFPELEKLNPAFIQRLIGYMTERARTFATTQLQQEKVSALGRLSAGIAHELNNPAAAINRISSELKRRVKINSELIEKLLQHNINPKVVQSIQNLVENKREVSLKKTKLSALQRIEREDQITDWLVENGYTESHSAAETFIDSGFFIDDLESIRDNFDVEAFVSILDWLENLLSSEKIIKDLEDASNRISRLVGAIKSHVHMDRPDLQCTNINNDIENTLTLLGYKLREKNISIKKIITENIPEVEAFVGELNQVWTNIIDNAIYAMPVNGELIVNLSSDKKNVKVSITDNGAGIPKEIISRIFDPFFTTKKVGDGTGIGLDIVHRVIKRHNGEIKVNSIPGKTEFIVCIPVSQKKVP